MTNWKTIHGSLKQLSVGAKEHIWGVDASDHIFRWVAGSWKQVDGQLKQISVGSDGVVWGFDAANHVYRREGDHWTSMPGELTQISTGSADHIWGVNTAGKIVQWTGSQWQAIAGALKQVSVGRDGTVWGVNAGGEVFKWKDGEWALVPGSLKQVSVGDRNHIWGVNAAEQIFRYTSGGWAQIKGELKHVSVSADNQVWGINSVDNSIRTLENDSADLLENKDVFKYVVAAQASSAVVVTVPTVKREPSPSVLRQSPTDFSLTLEAEPIAILKPVPKEQIQVPIALIEASAGVTDETLFESPTDATQKYYLPRYRLAEELVSGQQQYRISLSPSGQSWRLTVFLEAYPAPAIEDAARTATVIDHDASVVLQYQQQGQSRLMTFQEITKIAGNQQLKAVLNIRTLEMRDNIYLALSDASYGAALGVQREIEFATPEQSFRPSLEFSKGSCYVESVLSTKSLVSSLDITENLTIEAWINTQNASHNQKICGKTQLVNGRIGSGYLLGIVDNRLYAEIWDKQHKNHALVPQNTTGKIVSREWTHLAVTWGNGKMSGYINGTLVGQISTSGKDISGKGTPVGILADQSSTSGNISITPNPLRMGVAPWDPKFFHFRGQLKDVKLWREARTTEQIQQDMDNPGAQAQQFERSLVAYWPCDEGSGSQVSDRSGKNNHCTFKGPMQWGQNEITLYQAGTAALSHSVDSSFFFPTQLYGYIFQDLDANTDKAGLIRHQVQWQSQWYSYYQDAAVRYRFYYLPERFEFATDPNTQQPTLSLRFESLDGSPDFDKMRVRMQYYAAPVVSVERLQAAGAALVNKTSITLPHSVQGLEFIPLSTQSQRVQYRLELPQAGEITHEVKQRRPRVSLQDGIFDTVILPLADFQSVWDALFSTQIQQTLFTGEVSVAMTDTQTETIEFHGRLSGDPDALWEAILDPTIKTDYSKTISVRAFEAAFAVPSESAQQQIRALLVDFDRSDTVELTPSKLETSATILLPISDVVLRRPNPGVYHYKVDVIRASGRQTSRRIDTDMEIIYVPDFKTFEL